jgi:hypothetical protein
MNAEGFEDTPKKCNDETQNPLNTQKAAEHNREQQAVHRWFLQC